MPEVRSGFSLQTKADRAEPSLVERWFIDASSVHNPFRGRSKGRGKAWLHGALSSSALGQGGTENPMTTARILDFLRTRRPEGPCLVVDLDVVRDNFQSFRRALPDSSIYYAVKANPAPEILRLLAGGVR